MSKKSKAILGQWIDGRLHLSDEEKKVVIEDYLSGNETKLSVYERYTGYSSENGRIKAWMRKLGYSEKGLKSTVFVPMTKKKGKTAPDVEEFDNLRLRKRVEELENRLREAEMKAIAYSTMVDIAEQQLGVPIRKKYNTKP
jgi:hypothetical protein